MNADEELDQLYDDVDADDTEAFPESREWDEAYARDDEGPEVRAYLHEVLWTDERDALGGELAHHFYELPVAA